ncbi:MAG: hypothetical protein MJ006_00520 [Methanocorpusculum sp.]|nr:hypothetical protein [Methanocorpusculum sp.]
MTAADIPKTDTHLTDASRTGEMVPDPDFSEKEHAEFEKLEKENPYVEIKEETIRVPKRPERITATRNDPLILGIIIALAALFLGFILYMSYFR